MVETILLHGDADGCGELVQVDKVLGHVRGQHRINQALAHRLERRGIQVLEKNSVKYDNLKGDLQRKIYCSICFFAL